MRDVRVCHEEIVIADPGNAAAPGGASVDRDELAKDVVMAHDETRGLALELQILRRQSHRGKRKDLGMVADGRAAIDDGRSADLAVLTQGHILANDRVGPHDTAEANRRSRSNDRRRMNVWCT